MVSLLIILLVRGLVVYRFGEVGDWQGSITLYQLQARLEYTSVQNLLLFNSYRIRPSILYIYLTGSLSKCNSEHSIQPHTTAFTLAMSPHGLPST